MVDQASTKKTKAQIEIDDFVRALRKFRSGEQSVKELVAEIRHLLADGRVSTKELQATLTEEAKQSPLSPQVLKTLKQRIEFIAESDAEDDTMVDEHSEGDRQPPTTADHPDDSHVPLPSSIELALRQTLTSKAGNGDSRKSVGDVLNDRFEIVERIATRGMSIVYKAIDRHMPEAEDRDRYVTVKILKRTFQAHEESLLALQQAAKKAQGLEHPNIVKLFGLDRDGDTAYLIMEHLSGESLSQRIGSDGLREMSHKELLRIINQMGKALAFAHDQDVVHCDFKPANVYLSDNGEVKVLDFGLARVLYRTAKKDGHQVLSGAYSGLTPAYASPEMLESREPDPRDDVFALACTSYELLTGEHPFQRMRARSARDAGLKVERRGGLTRVQWQAFQAALEFDRSKRTPTVNTFLAELNAAERHHRRVIIATAAGIVGVVVFAFGLVGSNYYFEQLQTPRSSEFSKFEVPATPTDPVQNPTEQGVQRAASVPQGVSAEATRATTPTVTETGITGEESLAMERQLQTAQQEQERLLAELKDKRSETDSLRLSLEQSNAQLEQRQQALAATQSELERTQVELEQRRLEVTAESARAVERLEAMVQSLQTNINDQQQRVELLDIEKQEQRSELLSELESLQLKEKQLNQSLTIRNQQIAALQTQLGDMQRQQGQSSQEWETKLQDAQQESLRLEEEIEALKQKNREAAKAKASEPQQTGQYLATLLALAETQFVAKRLTTPAGNNALATYRQVLQVAPDHKDALRGIDRIKQEYQEWAAGARTAGNWQRAQANLEKALAVDPQDAALAEALRELKESRKSAEQEARQAEQDDTARQISTAGEQTAGLSDNADTSPQGSTAELAKVTKPRESIEARTPDLETLMTNARQQLAAERLIQPKEDNAWETFSRILERDPSNREAQAGLEAIPARLETLARNKRQQGKLEEGLAIVEDGLRVIPGHAGLRALKDDISGQLQAQQSAQEAEQAGEPGQTRSDAPESEQDEPAEQGKRRMRSFGSFF